MTWASGESRTPYSQLRSSWRKESGRFILEVSIPPNSSGTVYLPAADAFAILESGCSAPIAEGVSFSGTEEGRAVYLVGAGHYRFESDMLEGRTAACPY